MNFSQKLVLFILIMITAVYMYLAFFGKNHALPEFNSKNNNEENYVSTEIQEPSEKQKTEDTVEKVKEIKIYIIDKSGNIRSVNRKCEQTHCMEFAIKELVKAPGNWEKSKGFTSEIPSGTKVLSVRESENNIMIDLSSDFEMGGGTESTYTRVAQLIKTAKANTQKPVYLYLNGKQANVIGGDGIMLKQPLSERSLNE